MYVYEFNTNLVYIGFYMAEKFLLTEVFFSKIIRQFISGSFH